jgi:hypothetical protein
MKLLCATAARRRNRPGRGSGQSALRPNGSLEQTGRPTALPRPELRPGRPAAQFRR